MKKNRKKLILITACLLIFSSGCMTKRNASTSNTKQNLLITQSTTKENSKETSLHMKKDTPLVPTQTLSPNDDKIKTTSEKNSNSLPAIPSPPPVKYDPSSKLDPNKKIYIGTTIDELRKSMDGSLINYGSVYAYMNNCAAIFLHNDNGTIKVIGWDNINNVFNVSAGAKILSAPSITLGSSKEDVTRAMGTPYRYGIPYCQDANTCMYNPSSSKRTQWMFSGDSFVTFDGNSKVIGWYNADDLKVSYGVKDNSAPPVKLGSTHQDVLRAFGTPTALVPCNNSNIMESMNYNICRFTFDENGIVNGWTNKGAGKISMGNKNPSAPSFKIGSTMQDVINAMGTPDKVEQNFTWSYGNSTITFNSNWIVTNYCNTGNLKVD